MYKFSKRRHSLILCGPRIGYGFLDTIPRAQVKKKKDKMDFIKIKTICYKGHHQESEMKGEGGSSSDRVRP